MEIGYNIKFVYDEYGFNFFRIHYDKEEWRESTFSLSFDNNFIICTIFDECLKEMPNNKLYGFNKNKVEFYFR